MCILPPPPSTHHTTTTTTTTNTNTRNAHALSRLESVSSICAGEQCAYFGALSGWSSFSNRRLCLAVSGEWAFCPLLRSCSRACARLSLCAL